MNAQMGKRPEIVAGSWTEVSDLSPETLDRNCRRAGFFAVTMSALMMKIKVFDVIVTAMKEDYVVLDDKMIFIAGFMFLAGVILLYGGKHASRQLNVNKRTGKLPFGAWVFFSVTVFGAIALDLFVQEAVRVCLSGTFSFL